MHRAIEESIPRELLSTYRYLRLAMPLLVVMLLFSVFLQVCGGTGERCWLASISAYYYTPARSVFILCLCAMGTCLIVYRGMKREDFILNMAGCFAYLVALIPTPLKNFTAGETEEPGCARANAQLELIKPAFDNNLRAALAAAIVMAVLYLILLWKLPHRRSSGRPDTVTAVGTAALVTVATIVYVTNGDWVLLHGHEWSAKLLFIFVGLMVLMNIYPRRLAGVGSDAKPRYKRLYAATFWVMVIAGVVWGAVIWTHLMYNGLFWLEFSLIALFGLFWVIQTFEHWNAGVPPHESFADTTSRPATGATPAPLNQQPSAAPNE